MLSNPTIPASVPSRAVHIHVHAADGEQVVLRSPALHDAAGSLLLPEAQWWAELDADGEATLTVPCTDTATITPLDWSYAVSWSVGLAVPRGSASVPDGVGTLEFEGVFTPDGAAASGAVSYATSAQLAAEAAARVAADATKASTASVTTISDGLATLDAAITGEGGVGERLDGIEDGTSTLTSVTTSGTGTFGAAISTVVGGVTVGGENFFLPIRFGGRASYANFPQTGTWAVGDVVIASDGKWWLCTVAGTPGTWVAAS